MWMRARCSPPLTRSLQTRETLDGTLCPKLLTLTLLVSAVPFEHVSRHN